MIFDCPHCQQSLEVDDAGAGLTVECPTCHQPVTIPSVGEAASFPGPVAPDDRRPVGQDSVEPTIRPPMHVPLQPIRPDAPAPIIKRKRGRGCFEFLLVIVLLGGGAFEYAMYRWHQSPQQTWKHLTTVARRFVQEEFAPPSTPAPQETAKTTPAPPRPDPVAWLLEHKEQWPKEVILQKPVEFPAVSKGKVVGSLVVPAGAEVKVLGITSQEVAADFMGGNRRVAIGATDLRVRANAALNKAEAARQASNPSHVVAHSPAPMPSETPEKIREAGREEIRTGLGALYTRQATTFRVFAPTEKSVSVVLYDAASSNEGRAVYALRQELNGLWETSVRGDLLGKFYTYLLDKNDPQRAREVLDPYATNSVANSTRGRITPMTTPVGAGPALDSPTDAIIYEMQVRDFTIDPNSGVKNAGLYLGWTEEGTRLLADPSSPQDESVRMADRTGNSRIKTALDHLSELGVTDVELMPVQDFENDETAGNYNWGYITTDFFSPEGMFATNPNNNSRVRELKALIKALHSRGIGVIMDVVYNHTSGNCSLMSIAPGYYYRHAGNGSFANGSGCGNEVKSEAPMARRLILDSLKYWVKEYGVDGFRFDLMALIDQETMRDADRELRKIDPGIILFGEPWTGGATPLRDKTDKDALRQVPVGAFNDDFRNALKGPPDGSEPGWIQNGSKREALKTAMLVSGWFASPEQSINYMTCHDNLVLWDKLVASMPNATDALRIETMKLGYLTLFTSQGVPFFLGGGEFARTKGGNNNSYDAPDSVNEIDWELKRDHLDLFNYLRDVIALRKAHPMFRLRTRPDVLSRVHFIDTPEQGTLMFTINGQGVPGETWKRICVILNSADATDAEVGLPEGNWSVVLDDHGAASGPEVSGKVRVRYKSGVVLYQ
jgi:pullulanase